MRSMLRKLGEGSRLREAEFKWQEFGNIPNRNWRGFPYVCQIHVFP
jgi:hypothetical protein